MSVPFRLVLRKVEMNMREDESCHFVVWLAGRGEIFTGEAISADDEESQLIAVSQATIQAINKALRKPVDLKLLFTKQLFIKEVGKVVLLVIIQVGSLHTPRLVPGICLFTTLTPEIAARATLNALNRTIAKMA